MATRAILLLLRHNRQRDVRNPTLLHFFSSSPFSDSDAESKNNSSSTNPSPPQSQSQSQSQSSFSSYFSDVKASLKQQTPSQQRSQIQKPFSFPPPADTSSSKISSLREISKNLSEFRSSSADPTPEHKISSSSISFSELYKRNVIPKGEGTNNEANRGKQLSFDAIRESLRHLRSTPSKIRPPGGEKFSDAATLSNFRNTLKMRPDDPKVSPFFIGGSGELPPSVFNKELLEKDKVESPAMKTEFLKMYNYGELGKKLRMLRPEGKKGNKWFSLEELNERLMKLREIEEKEAESRIGGVSFRDLRQSLLKLRTSDVENERRASMQRINVLGQLDGTAASTLPPPKEHLVEKYFHPDNMSSSEKLAMELKKVRDEFKISESDCGSTRVQVAQLTTKIKHLSGVLHKKDKHSKKGLLAMVQRRKKLLKYLRRTDWDSYCFVLSKLGLRDIPNVKSRN